MLTRQFIIEQLGLEEEFCTKQVLKDIDKLIKKLNPYKEDLLSGEYLVIEDEYVGTYLRKEKYRPVKKFCFRYLGKIILFYFDNI